MADLFYNGYGNESKSETEEKATDNVATSNTNFWEFMDYDETSVKSVKKAYKKIKKHNKKIKKVSSSQKKLKKKVKSLESDLAVLKKERYHKKVQDLVNSDSVAERKRLVKELYGEEVPV